VDDAIRPFGKDVIGLKSIPSSDANARWVAKGWEKPYLNGSRVRSFETGAEMQFVRVHGVGNRPGAFVVRAKEIAGMSPKQIQQHLALPKIPTHISDVVVPAGTRMNMGRVAPQPKFGVTKTQGIQYELLDEIPGSSFQNTRPLGE
jgi:filamentous hemagglutinin